MGTLPHRIFRQKWQVAVGSEAEAFSLRKQIRDRWEDTFLPVFERAFTEHSGGDEILYIPKLEFNLKVSGDNVLLEKIGEELSNQLSEMLVQGKYDTGRSVFNNHLSGNSQSDNSGFYNQFSINPGLQQPETGDLFDGQSSMVRIPAKQYRLEVLLHYFQYGNLPWQENLQANEASTELLAAIKEHRHAIADYLHNYKVSHVFLFRLFQFLSYDEIIWLSKDLCSYLSFAAKEELNNLTAALISSGEIDLNPHTRKVLLAVIIEAGISHHPSNTIPDWFEKAENHVPPEKLDKLRQYCNSVPGNPLLVASGRRRNQDKSNPTEILDHTLSAMDDQNRRKETTLDYPGLSGLEGLLPGGGQFIEYPDFKGNLPTDDSDKGFSGSLRFGKLQHGGRIVAQNAGLLLLHPFITSFFNHTGVLAVNEREIPQCNLANAAALLHFLATGREEVFEFELGFIKILLGLDPDQSLTVSEGTLSKEQKEESESLLTSVVGHWTALKNTSVNGLQTTFIQRTGMIFETDDGWQLLPESKSYDILLNTLPWGFSMVKLPWMTKPIYTEWQTN
jgi:hypothetical protein